MNKSKNTNPGNVRVGVHTSIAGGISKSIERAAALGCSTMQIFSHNPRQWKKTPISIEEVERFRLLRQRYDISPVFIHVSYLINLASRSDSIFNKSMDLLVYELLNADMVGAEYIVLHTGSASGDDEYKARGRAIKALSTALADKQFKATILLENTAGERGDITSTVTALADIIEGCRSSQISGICLDTCHAFSSGYDLSTGEGLQKLLLEVKKYVGLDKLRLIHLNDSKKPLGSGVDRHEHIGGGFIGISGFKNILSEKSIAHVPCILETPKKSEDDDRHNLDKVRGLRVS